MSFMQRLFGTLDKQEQQATAERQLTRDEVIRVLIEHVQTGHSGDEETDESFIAGVITNGVMSRAEVAKLHDAAVALQGYILVSEAPAADETKAEAHFRKVAEKAKADLEAAAAAVSQAREFNGERQASRQQAQRLVNSYPELQPMFESCSWQPTINTQPTSTTGAPRYVDVTH